MAKKRTELNVGVRFGDVKIGQGTVRVGLTIDRADTKLQAIDEVLCNAQLDVAILLDPADADQEVIEGMEDHPLHLIATTGGYSVTGDHFTSGLTFKRSAVDDGKLAKFARGKGTLRAKRTGDAKVEAAGQMTLGAEGDSTEDKDAA